MSDKTSYAELIAQRENLDSQIALAREEELRGVTAQVRRLVEEHQLTAVDIFGSNGKARGASSTKGVKVAPKYRDPATGKTWTGRGKAPVWYRESADKAAFVIAK